MKILRFFLAGLLLSGLGLVLILAPKLRAQSGPPASQWVIQWQNQGTPIMNRAGGFLPINCSTGMSCSYSGGVVILTSTGGGGSFTAGGDLSGTGSSQTVIGINGTLLSGLSSGLLFITTSTGAPTTIPGAAGQILAGATPAFTATPVLGTDNSVAGTLQLANSAANAHTIFKSGATTTNTIAGFTAVPTTGDLVSCTSATTVCTLTDAGVLAANVLTEASPGAGIARSAGSTQVLTTSELSGAVVTSGSNATTFGTIGANTTLANVTGSTAAPTAASIPAGVQFYTSGTGYSAATSANLLAVCTTCVVASSPGVGVAHFAGSTQTVTSSLIVAADITSATITGTQLAASLALTTPNIGAATGTSLLVTGILDGKVPVTVTTGTTATLGAATYQNSYTYNQEATAGTGVTYTLPATAVGLQYCVKNSIVSGTGAADTGVLTVYPAASSYVILNGVRNTIGGGGTHGVASGGAAADSACFVAIDATDWDVYVQSGTWTAN